MARQYLSQTTDAARVLGLQLAAARRYQRRTTAEIAERAGITRVTLRRIERGEPDVGLGLYFEVAGNHLGVRPSYLIDAMLGAIRTEYGAIRYV